MPHDRRALLDQLRALLTEQRFSSVVVHNYCRSAEHFLVYLARRDIAAGAAMPDHVSGYLAYAVRKFRQRHGHPPAPRWESIPRAGIHALLRLVQKPWPPEQPPASPAEALCRSICNEYREWLQVQRGLAKASIRALMWEGRNFLSWYAARSFLDDLRKLNVREIDSYFEMRAAGLRRRSLKDVAERLRSLMRFLQRTDRVGIDLAPRIIAPVLYAYESIPSALSPEEISAVLKNTRKDRSPLGYRDYAMLMLLSTYRLRDGEITRLRLEDIDWRAETLHIRHSKTGASSQLPLMAVVGGALLNYLRRGRPKTDVREIFIRTRAPYRRLSSLYSEVRRRLEAAGVKPLGKCGPHTFRHARAVSLLRELQIFRRVLSGIVPVQHAVETLQNDFQAKQLQLEVELPDGPLNASADETRIAQILINLLSNSLKFTPAGGSVRVKLAERAGSAVLTVQDTGIGIDPDLVPQLFIMFFQTNQPPKVAQSGLGVGLAVAKVLVELHGGTIEAHSAGEGTGAEFTVVLPMVASIAEQSTPPTRRVLVVDDNPDHLALLAELLRSRGYDVIEADDAFEALRLVSDQKPDACVIDIGLPGMDGYELARKLREIPATRESRLIAVTGHGTKSDQDAFKEAGFDHFFPKPADIEELNRALIQK